MPVVIPSQVVAAIDAMFLNAKDLSPDAAIGLHLSLSEHICIIVTLVEQIPSDLITLEGEDYAGFAASVALLNNALAMWPGRGETFHGRGTVPGLSSLDPIRLLRKLLLKCPDHAVSREAPELRFIRDKQFRSTLRSDLTEVQTALVGREWKSATVLAGSVVEALLLWKLQQQSGRGYKDSCISVKGEVRAGGRARFRSSQLAFSSICVSAQTATFA